MISPSNSVVRELLPQARVRVFVVFSGVALVTSGCSLLQNTDSLSSGYRNPVELGGTSAGGAAGAVSGAANGGTASLSSAGTSTGGQTATGGDGGASGGAAVGGTSVGGAVDTGGASGGGVGGASGSGGGSAVCVPGSKDTSCDGLDQNCKATIQESGCPTGCVGITLAGNSYMGCTTSATFNDAEILCEAQHMRLVKIESKSENGIVAQIAESLGSYVWIGGSDLAAIGTFSWVDGTVFYEDGGPLGSVYENFGAGQPDTTGGLDCVQIHDDSAGPWSTAHCSDTEQFICKRY
jgi:hypothetical protein